MTWAGYAIDAMLGSLTLLVSRADRRVSPKVAQFECPGVDGAYTQYHGRKSHQDSVEALVAMSDVAALEKLAESQDIVAWKHPLLSAFSGRVTELQIAPDSAMSGYCRCSFTIVEHRETLVPRGTTSTPSANAAQSAAQNAWSGLSDSVDDLGDTDLGDDFDAAWADLGDAWTDVDSAYSALIDGTGTLIDVERAGELFGEAIDPFVEAVRDIEDTIGDVAREIESAPILIAETIRQSVDDLSASVQRTARVITTDLVDLPSVLLDLGLDVDANLEAVMVENGIDDPFAVLAGTELRLPL